jgi:hypothetical protein
MISVIKEEDLRILPWIRPTNLYLKHLYANKNAMHLFDETYFNESLNCELLSINTSPIAIDILQKNPYLINWNLLSSNESAIELLQQNMDKINWMYLSKNTNPNAIPLLEEYVKNAKIRDEQDIECTLDKYGQEIYGHYQYWMRTWIYSNPNALHLFHEDKNQWNYFHLCSNTNSEIIEFIDQLIDTDSPNSSQLCWASLSSNPAAIDILKKNPDKIIWNQLSRNPEAIDMLENNPYNIDWFMLSENPGIFMEEYSYVLK